jgi:hypothetical protein
MKTTLNKIWGRRPGKDAWEKLLAHLGKTRADDAPIDIATILQSNGLDDALWCLRAVEGHDREIRLYSIWCARQVQHLIGDKGNGETLDVAERFVNGLADLQELGAAVEAVGRFARDAWHGSRSAAWSAAEWSAAARWTAVARINAGYGAWASAEAAVYAADAADRAAGGAERAAMVDAQAAELSRVLQCIDAGADPYPVLDEQGPRDQVATAQAPGAMQ